MAMDQSDCLILCKCYYASDDHPLNSYACIMMLLLIMLSSHLITFLKGVTAAAHPWLLGNTW